MAPQTRREILASLAALAAPFKLKAQALAPGGSVDGVRRIVRDTVIAETLTMLPGARFDVAPGTTLTLLGDLIASAETIFSGSIDLTRSRIVAARPEWWGARAGAGGNDCSPALEACLAAHFIVQLGAGDYAISRTLEVARQNRRIRGIARFKNLGGTRLLLAAATGPVLRAGTEADPGSLNAHIAGLDLAGLELARNVMPQSADAVGLRVAHVLDAVFTDIRSIEHPVGYSVKAAVRAYLRDCLAFRSTTRGAAAGDQFIGFDLGGESAGMAGGNASVYLIDCNAATGAQPSLARSIGVRLTRGIADTFLTRFECASLAEGIVINGEAQTLSPERRRGAHCDVTIDSCVLDQCTHTGISVSNLSDQAAVQITNPYVALSPTGVAAIALADIGGGLTIDGGQLLGQGVAAAGSAVGVSMTRCSGIAIDGLKLLAFPRAATVKASHGLDLVMTIVNNERRSSHPAIDIAGSGAINLRPTIHGIAQAYAGGVIIDAASRAVSVETAAIEVEPKVARGGKSLIPSGNRVAID